MLQTLPEDLNETYDRILQNIPASRVPNAIKLFQLLTYSKRPLRLEEVVDALATEPDMEPPFDAENRISPPDAIIGYCANLVRITTAHSNDVKDELKDRIGQFHPEQESELTVRKETTIQFAHFSVREYLLLDRKETPYYHYFTRTVANGAITRILLAYLWTAAEAQGTPNDMFEYPLIKLATQYWMDHAATSGEQEEATFAWTRKIFTNSSFLQYWVQLHSRGESFHANPALYFASRFALHRSVGYLLSMGADPNAQGGRYGNPLQAAMASGDVQTVAVLLDHGASRDAIGGWYGSALHAAAWYGRIDTLQLLLTYGADVGALKWQGGSAAIALQVAAYKGHTGIVETLLMHGADVNARNIQISAETEEFNKVTHHYTALEAASFSGRFEVVKILLNNNAEINARGPHSVSRDADDYISREGYIYGTPLQAASMMGHLNIARILVERGADVNVQSGRWGYALHAALCNAHTVVALFLIESGADVQAKGGVHKTTLYAAVDGGDLTMVRLLIENGLDANESANDGKTPLICACEAGRIQTVKLLLDNGAEVNAQGGEYGIALYAASSKGHLEVVELLLRAGADVNAVGGRYICALCAAAYKGHIDVVRVLLKNGAVAETPTNFNGLALQDAIEGDNKDITELMSEQSALEEANNRQSQLPSRSEGEKSRQR
ncbi:hypothetical protein KCU77_g1033, partial [Aureobasidium melanogenum]